MSRERRCGHFPDSGYGERRRGAILMAAGRPEPALTEEAAALKDAAHQKETER
ncbi:hypothetical protein [Streptomyces sp. NPDC059900]|uniref:hypothetical protein n=1 Tax=Streptomyces sp. NPDC059900 TaxID=3155816 RepID=UPI003D004037